MKLTLAKIKTLPIGKKISDGQGLCLTKTAPNKGRWVHAGKFPPPYKLVEHTFFSREEVLAFIEEKKKKRGFGKPKIKK